ncbi:hypothetical protein DFH29DRAFT_1005015 [Suillus ampliporus]|nr:hypothetical protein DFH29DRAFT_1005015 [Suillus ampliporus]
MAAVFDSAVSALASTATSNATVLVVAASGESLILIGEEVVQTVVPHITGCVLEYAVGGWKCDDLEWGYRRDTGVCVV